MSRSLTEARITTRNARATLGVGTHWRSIDPDVHLGYRKGARGGRWIVRFYTGDQKYRQSTIGTADDSIEQDTLSFDQAIKTARLAVVAARRANIAAEGGPIPTVKTAVESYIKSKDARILRQTGRKIRSDTSQRLGLHVLKDITLVGTELHNLTEACLKKWRSKLGSKLKTSSVQRIVSDLKAALNAAYQENRKAFPSDFAETVRMGLKAPLEYSCSQPVARDNQILTDEQVRRIIELAIALDEDGDLARLIITLAATGARFSQIARMQVRDVQTAQFRMMVPHSRKGRNRVAGYTVVQVGQDVIESLGPAIEGRADSEPLLCRWRHVQTGPAKWIRDSRGPWQYPSEMSRQWRSICTAADLPGIVPYALRHSSIVRGIRHGLPIRLVAALHDTSVVMIERHYARWITDGLEELAAKAVIPLMPTMRLDGVQPV